MPGPLRSSVPCSQPGIFPATAEGFFVWLLLFQWDRAPIDERIMPGKFNLTFDFGPLLLGALHRVHRKVRGHVDGEVAV